MRFTQNSRTYRITFKYVTLPDQRREATCIIETVDEKVRHTYSVGNSICAKGDQFCYETGRKVSLMRALEGEARPFRKAAWEAYHNRTLVAVAA